MDQIKIENLLNLDETIAKNIFQNCVYPWEVLPKIKDFVISLGNSLNKDEFNLVGENIWIHKTVVIAKTASITGPCIIDEGTEIRHSAFIRGNVIIGKNSVIGNSTELKNTILFNNVQVPHYNYVGDSILGYKAHMGAGSIASNVKTDKTLIKVKYNNSIIETGLKKFGSIIGDNSEIGCGSVLNPGSIIGRNVNIYPLSSVRGIISKNSIYKNQNEIISKI